MILVFHELARHRFCCNSFHSQFLKYNSLGEALLYNSHVKKLRNTLATVLRDQSMQRHDILISSEDIGSKPQLSIFKTKKPLVNLHPALEGVLVKCSKYNNCFGYHFYKQATDIYRETLSLLRSRVCESMCVHAYFCVCVIVFIKRNKRQI